MVQHIDSTFLREGLTPTNRIELRGFEYAMLLRQVIDEDARPASGDNISAALGKEVGRSVDEVDAKLDRPPEKAMTLRSACRLPSRSGDSHGAEPEAVDRKLTSELDLACEPGQGLTLSGYGFRR